MALMLRVGSAHWLDDGQLERLIQLLSRSGRVFDELAFFTASTHAPLPIAKAKARLSRLKGVMERVRRELDVRAGVNVLTTMGHHEENLEESLDQDWQRVVGESGRICRGTYCPLDEHLREYVRELYIQAALSSPDFIWIDDDVRLAGHGAARYTCFCDQCLSRFSEEVGRPFAREQLVRALSKDFSLRRRWLEHNRRIIQELLSIIRRAVDSVDPSIEVGFMTGDRFYEGYDFSHWAEAISGDSPARWRPGGGFYWDDVPMGLVEKAHDVGRQVASLPVWVETIQSELESFPHHMLKKSIHTVVVESVAHLAAGATGIAFNILTQHAEPLEQYRPLLEEIRNARRVFLPLGELGRQPARGIFPAWNRDLFLVNGSSGNWFGPPNVLSILRRQYVLGEVGLPMCYDMESASVVTLSGSIPESLSDDDLEQILRKGVYMDAEACKAICKRGFSDLVGVEVGAEYSKDTIEIFTGHELNGNYASRKRDCRQSFWPEPAYTLNSVENRVSIVSRLTNYRGDDLGPCLSIYENRLGGRVAVSGYYPWFLIHSDSKTYQLKSLFLWLGGNRLPIVVDSFAKIVAWARGRRDDCCSYVLVNASLDRAEKVEVSVRSPSPAITLVTMNGDWQQLELDTHPDNFLYRRLVIPKIEPWGACLLLQS